MAKKNRWPKYLTEERMLAEDRLFQMLAREFFGDALEVDLETGELSIPVSPYFAALVKREMRELREHFREDARNAESYQRALDGRSVNAFESRPFGSIAIPGVRPIKDAVTRSVDSTRLVVHYGHDPVTHSVPETVRVSGVRIPYAPTVAPRLSHRQRRAMAWRNRTQESARA